MFTSFEVTHQGPVIMHCMSENLMRSQQVIVLEEPALAQLQVRNCTDRALGGLLLRHPEESHPGNIVLQVPPTET